jgi:hypothetical protein
MTHKDRSPEGSLLPPANSNEAGSSKVPPPSFKESGGDAIVTFEEVTDVSPAGGEEPPKGEEPPEFTPYEAEHWVSGSDKIISHDPHLNEDGA